jgi:dipeptidyl aminopeptidase/acylaminoacyl peptidase
MVAYLLVCSTSVMAQMSRTLTPADLLKREEIDDFTGVRIAPNGQDAAFVRRRSVASAMNSHQPFIADEERSDIWIVSLGAGTSRNLTHGEEAGKGFWRPIWSPDSTRIAMLVTDGDNYARLCVWDKSTDRISLLSDRAISREFGWLDNHRIVVLMQPLGLDSSLKPEVGANQVREWRKQAVGEESTASVLDSGILPDLAHRPQKQIVIIDLNTNAILPLASAIEFSDINISPDGSHVAYLKEVARLPPEPTKLLSHDWDGIGPGHHLYQLEIANASGVVVPQEKLTSFATPGSFQWSPDSHAFAYLGAARDGDGFYLLSGKAGATIEPVALLNEMRPLTFKWVDQSRLLLLAQHQIDHDGKEESRRDWFMVSVSGTHRALSEKLATVPPDLVPVFDGGSFVGIAGADLWRVDIATGKWVNLTSSFDEKITKIVWPNANSLDASVNNVVLVTAMRGALLDYYRVDVASGTMTRLDRPSDHAKISAYRAETDLAFFTAIESTGTYLNIVQGNVRRTVLEINTYLSGITCGGLRKINYRGIDGEELKGWIVLPPGYKTDKRYPMVVYVYPGWIMGDSPPSWVYFSGNAHSQLLAAKGYVVLIPSLPLGAEGKASDPYMELTKGVLPAVDKVVDLGIADPKRLAVLGMSAGAYSTYAIVTQTTRFQAAIAMNGPSDLISWYGLFLPRRQYDPYPQEVLMAQSYLETGGILNMGNPPWKDVNRYIRNSPIFYVDRVQTPMLIVHGDMDFLSMTQAEEFFNALYRQRKRARFIRYWGEGHGNSSPANISDLWMHIYAWLDEFCDISRDRLGNLVWDGDKVKSREGALPLKPEDFSRFNEMEQKSRPWVKN